MWKIVKQFALSGFWMFARDTPEAHDCEAPLHRHLFFQTKGITPFLGEAGVAGHQAQTCRSAPHSSLAESGATPPKQIEEFLKNRILYLSGYFLKLRSLAGHICPCGFVSFHKKRPQFQQKVSLPSPHMRPSASKSMQWLVGKETLSSSPTA